MSKPHTGVSASLRNALRQVNAAYNRLTAEAQDQIEIPYDGLDREIDAAILSGDREGALTAIRAWRDLWLYRLGKARR